MILVGIFLFGLVALSSGDVGDICGDNVPSRCVLARDCKAAVDSLKKRKPHGLERCGFENLDEIVCCPTPDDYSVRNPEIRKSDNACKNFNKDILGILPFILGGENATLGEFPHMAALGYEDETRNDYNFECGGSLISEDCILTAAHCLVRQDGKEPKIIRLGTVDVMGKADDVEPQDVPVLSTHVHEKYTWESKENDIAIIRLSKPVSINGNVKPICLYTSDNDPDELVVAGWGKTGNTREGSRFLLKTYLKSVPLKECNVSLSTRAFGKPIFDTQFCALSRDSKPRDTCEGDSGGPMQIEEKKVYNVTTLAALVGVTSYGPLCGGSLPSIYTRVSKYLDWIENIVWP